MHLSLRAGSSTPSSGQTGGVKSARVRSGYTLGLLAEKVQTVPVAFLSPRNRGGKEQGPPFLFAALFGRSHLPASTRLLPLSPSRCPHSPLSGQRPWQPFDVRLCFLSSSGPPSSGSHPAFLILVISFFCYLLGEQTGEQGLIVTLGPRW